ncbi:MAG: hypothetical protein ABJA78_12985 [Ferruginibacter sp.]
MATKKKKSAAPKKAAIKKKTAAKKSKPPLESDIEISATPETEGIPCICKKIQNRWFCMVEKDGALVKCDGPFATQEECEAHTCI